MSPALKTRYLPFVLAGLIVGILYSVHLIFCQRSTLQYMDGIFAYSDMRGNLLWAAGIREQGWLNAAPYHPWTNWMQLIAPYGQWVNWWGGEQVFQQSPLYAYLLSLFVPKHLFLMRMLQALMSVGTCVFIGLLAFRLSGRTAGWIAFWLAALFSPFYAYSWPFLRDGLGWFLSAALLWTLSELTQAEWPSSRARQFAWLSGALLGLGFLARETFLLLIPLTWATLGIFAWQRRRWGALARVAVATVLTISPLVIRNRAVNAPLLSTSNRFVETFIYGNSAHSHPYEFDYPPEAGNILTGTHARPLQVVFATIHSHPDGFKGWMKLQCLKLLSLFDPFESPDNLSFYFVANISPVVSLALRYWMILPLGLAGLVLSVGRRDSHYLWFWIFLPVFLISLLIGTPLSRYRQSLVVFLIPWAAYFLVFLAGLIRERKFRYAISCGFVLLAGWGLILGPLARQPRNQYERPQEYMWSAIIFYQHGEQQKGNAMIALIRQKFPGALSPRSRPADVK